MKIRSERDKRNYIIIALCMVVVIMGVGYAAFSSLLTINGTANISNSWCVGFDNTKTSDMQITKGLSTGTTPTGSMSYSGTACGSTLQPTSSLVAHFYQPGDQIEYILTITNKSTVTAAIKSILVDNESVTSDTTKKKDNITYIVEMPESTTLTPNASTTMKVTAKFQNETDVTGPYSGETKTIEVKINAEQDDGDGGMDITPVSSAYTGPIYRWNTTKVNNGDFITEREVVVGGNWCAIAKFSSDDIISTCDNAVSFNTQEECEAYIENVGTLPEGVSVSCAQETQTVTTGGVGEYTTDASTSNGDYYLKHDVVEDIITASYVCFVYNNAEHCMKGGDNESSLESKPIFDVNTQIIKDFQTFNSLPDNATPGCYYNSSSSYCYGNDFNVSANTDGLLHVDGGFHTLNCYVSENDSYCSFGEQ